MGPCKVPPRETKTHSSPAFHSTHVMRLIQANVRGLNPSKINFLQDIISTLQLKIICITESHLLNHIKDSFLSIPHFNMYRSDAAGSTYKHGVCAYVHESLHVDTIETPMPNLLSFRLSSSNIHIVVVYQPHPTLPVSTLSLFNTYMPFVKAGR